jgi:LmbE family N-acetylglucosaminyl deacetylase
MMARPDFLRDSLIIAAHADDELLWFGSILQQTDEVLVVFRDFWAKPGLGDRRARALADHPHPRISFLGLAESGAAGCADWVDPVETGHGIRLGLESSRRRFTHAAKLALSRLDQRAGGAVASDAVDRLYRANFEQLVERLRPRLRPSMNVFTHNPWGEYGHEEHVQVFRALQLLRREIGFTLWMSNYATERSLPMAMRYFHAAPGPYRRLPVDKAYADAVAEAYKRHDCWTWADDWAWFDEECFMEAPDSSASPKAHQHLFPLNVFTIDAARRVKWLPIAVGAAASAATVTAIME